jgi:hypothetical protein
MYCKEAKCKVKVIFNFKVQEQIDKTFILWLMILYYPPYEGLRYIWFHPNSYHNKDLRTQTLNNSSKLGHIKDSISIEIKKMKRASKSGKVLHKNSRKNLGISKIKCKEGSFYR